MHNHGWSMDKPGHWKIIQVCIRPSVGYRNKNWESHCCNVDIVHPLQLCMKTYAGSSKGMEAYGAVKNVLHLFKSYDSYCYTIIMDDDLSKKSVLRHSLEEKRQKQRVRNLFSQDITTEKYLALDSYHWLILVLYFWEIQTTGFMGNRPGNMNLPKCH